MPFNPDQYLADKSAPNTATPFDPTKYLTDKISSLPDDSSFIGKAFERVDAYTGAPTRAAIGTLLDEKNKVAEGDPSVFSNAASAFKNQWGAPSQIAPSQTDLASKLGFSKNPIASSPDAKAAIAQGLLNVAGGLAGPIGSGVANLIASPQLKQTLGNVSPAQAAGVPIGIAADYTNLIPTGLIAKGLSKTKGLLTGAKDAETAIEGAMPVVRESPLVSGPFKNFPASPQESLLKDSPKVYEFKPTTPEEFLAARNQSSKGEFLTPLEPKDLENHKLFMTDNGVGYSLSPTGDLGSVFNNSGIKGAGKQAVAHGIANGAKTLDAFDGYLPYYYNDFGFNLTNSVKWDDKYAPKGWDYEKYGTPNVVYMEYPKALSREPDKVASRFESARVERADAASGKSGGPPAVSEPYGFIDWQSRGELDKAEQASSTLPISSNSENVTPNRTPGLLGKLAGKAVGAGMGYALGHGPGAVIGTLLSTPEAVETAVKAGQIPIDLIQKLSGKIGLTKESISAAIAKAQTPEGMRTIEALGRAGLLGQRTTQPQ